MEGNNKLIQIADDAVREVLMVLGRKTDVGFTSSHRVVGMIAALAVFVLGVAYLIITALGFLLVESPHAGHHRIEAKRLRVRGLSLYRADEGDRGV